MPGTEENSISYPNFEQFATKKSLQGAENQHKFTRWTGSQCSIAASRKDLSFPRRFKQQPWSRGVFGNSRNCNSTWREHCWRTWEPASSRLISPWDLFEMGSTYSQQRRHFKVSRVLCRRWRRRWSICWHNINGVHAHTTESLLWVHGVCCVHKSERDRQSHWRKAG